MEQELSSFRTRFSRNYVTIVFLLLVPSLMIFPFILLVVSVPHLPDWVLLLSVCLFMVFMILVVRWLYDRVISVPCDVTIGPERLRIKLCKWSPFYPVTEYDTGWDSIDNVSTNYDPRHEKHFYLVRFRKPAQTLCLMPEDTGPDEAAESFGATLLRISEAYSATHSMNTPAITHRSMYDTALAKGFTVLVYLVMVGVLLLWLLHPHTVSVARLVQIFIISGTWLAAYYANRKKPRYDNSKRQP